MFPSGLVDLYPFGILLDMNSFKAFWSSLSRPEKDDLARRLDTSTMYLFQVANGHKNAGKHLRRLISFETGLPRDAFEEEKCQ